ncbi:MAG: IclR family transcriptional regulator [Spirochaetaceae bacterium]
MLHYNNESSNNNTKSYRPTETVLKAFRILEYISEHGSVKPAQITRALGLSRTNVHRLLATLLQVGYVTKDPTHGYRLSFKLFKLGSRVPLSRDLRDVARPVMNDLMRRANENVYLTVLYGHMVIAVEEIKSANPLSLNPDVTYSYPIHACASGKIFLSAMDASTRNRLLSEMQPEKLTENTVTAIEEMEREIERTRQRGYATELAEFSDDLNSYAAPIFDYRGKMVAGLSISGPSLRATKERLDGLVDDLQDAAASISRQLGKGQDNGTRGE